MHALLMPAAIEILPAALNWASPESPDTPRPLLKDMPPLTKLALPVFKPILAPDTKTEPAADSPEPATIRTLPVALAAASPLEITR
jgi:hypothetical protein